MLDLHEQMKKINPKNFNILYDNIFVRAIEIEERGGILIPSSYEEKPELGEVLKTGPGKLLDNGSIAPMSVKVGDIVYFNKYSATKFNIDGEDFWTVREEDVVGFIR